MKKLILSFVLSISFLFGSVGLASANNVAVQGNLALIADGNLLARNILTGDTNICFSDGHFAPAADRETKVSVSDLLATATDVAIEANNAVVTYDVLDENLDKIGIDIVTVDITSCLGINDVVVDVQECISTVNIEEGELTIPCVEINGEIVTVEMERRGNSDNWEVSFFGANLNFGSGDHDDDDHDDDDHDDDDDNG